jgi:prephenate dehydratase
VRFALLARPGVRQADIRTVASHPHGIAQTREWIAANLPGAEVLTSTSTSESAAQVARGQIDAAVAAPLAGAQHGLQILVDDIADNRGAITRFALLSRPGRPPAASGADRTTLVATVQNRPGALVAVLTELTMRGIDLTRIESRPIKDRHAEYWFHLDCTGHVSEPAMGEALAALHRRCDQVRFLGSYPRAANGPVGGEGATAPDGPRAADFAAAAEWLAGLRAGTRS